jgi:ankyrin repeat protein
MAGQLKWIRTRALTFTQNLFTGFLYKIKQREKYLLDVNVKDNRKMTPLHYASVTGNLKIVQLLKDSGAKYSHIIHSFTFDISYVFLCSFHLFVGKIVFKMLMCLMHSKSECERRERMDFTPLCCIL